MGAKKCLVCGSGEVSLWLGGSIGTLYHGPECQYTGPIVIEGELWEGLNKTRRFHGEVEVDCSGTRQNSLPKTFNFQH